MPTYSVRLVCEASPDPVSGETYDATEETITVDAPSAWAAKHQATVRMTIHPMGRLLRAYDAETGREITPPDPEPFRPAQFRIDGLPGTYEGFSRGETWNGFAVPYFPLEEARRIADDYAAQPQTPDGQTRSEFDEARAVIRLFDPSADEWDEIEPVALDNRQAYPVGTRLWTWEEVDE